MKTQTKETAAEMDKRITFTVDPKIHTEIKMHALKEGKTMRDFAIEVMLRAINRKKKDSDLQVAK